MAGIVWRAAEQLAALKELLDAGNSYGRPPNWPPTGQPHPTFRNGRPNFSSSGSFTDAEETRRHARKMVSLH